MRGVRFVAVAVVLAGLALGILAIESHEPEKVREDWEYRGGDGIWACGALWSIDRHVFTCEHGSVAVEALRRFARLDDLRFEDVEIRESGGIDVMFDHHVRQLAGWEALPPAHGATSTALDGVQYVNVENVNVPGWFMERVPNAESLYLTNARFEMVSLAFTPKLRNLGFRRMPVTDVAPIVALPALEEVAFIIVPNGDALAAELHRRRPDVKIQIIRAAGPMTTLEPISR